MKIFRNTGINLKIIIGVIIPVICTFIVFLLIVTLLLNAKTEKLFKEDLIPFFNTRLAEMEKEVGSVLYEHSEENRKSFESLYTNEMENLAKALAETALPLAESFDYEAIERLLAEHLLKTGDTEQFIRIYLENSSSPAMEKGTLPDEPMTFFYVTQSDFGYVKIALLVSQNPLRELFRREDERMTHISDHIRNIGGKMSASISSQSITFKSEIMTGLYRWVSILGSGVILFVSTGLFIFITKNIIIPLKRIVGGLKKISDEELLASEHLASASQLMAKNAAEQAMLIENTGKTIEKTAKMVKQNAGRADKAQKMTQENFLIREKVSSRMSEMSDAIARIAETGRKTTTIVKTIDEIAFQTKLLALNAAVEAAHAGNAGAGFGIIAEEVRNLALKSGSAAKETSDMIEDMLNYIQQGSRLTDAAQETFKKNMEVAAGTGQLVKEIAEASVGQTRNAQQISQAMSKADDAVQRNAVGAEENAAIAEQINENAAQIQLFVSELKNVLAGRQ